MATTFCCEHCGCPVSAEAQQGGVVVCRHCRRRTEIPAALAHLPTPQLAGPQAPPPVDDYSAPDKPGGADESAEPGDNAPAMRRIAATMPWVVSAAIHVALGLMLMLLVFMVIDPADGGPPPRALAEAANTARPPIETWTETETDPDASELDPQHEQRLSDSERPPAPGRGDVPGPDDPIIGVKGPPSGGKDEYDIGGPEIGGPPGGREPFNPGGAGNLVYVVDRSGSMHKTFGIVRVGMRDSITALRSDEYGQVDDPNRVDQAFHVIFFAAGQPQEHGVRRLVAATEDNKASACMFLQEVQPGGQTDPVPALERAFAVLSQTAEHRPGKVLFLLTDGDFPDNQEVLDTIAQLNRRKTVMINTILFGRRTPEAERVMAQIARENRGEYKYVSLDEIEGDIR